MLLPPIGWNGPGCISGSTILKSSSLSDDWNLNWDVDTVDSVDIVAAGSTGSEETVIEPTTDTITPTTDTVTVPTNPTDTTTDDVLFTQKELIALRFLFSLFDRTDTGYISYDDFIVYAEDCCDPSYIRYIPTCIDIIDIDTDGVIGFLDFIYFAERLKYLYIHNVEVSF